MTQAYPLKWPAGWPRTPEVRRSPGNQFGNFTQAPGQTWKSRRPPTPAASRDRVREELRKLGASNVTISSNVPVRNDGEWVSGAADRRHPEPGIAVYFMLKGKPLVMAQDAYQGLAENLTSLALAIEAMRSLERHGGGTMMQRAFDGFSALPPPAGSKPKRPWWTVLRYSENPEDRELLSAGEVEARYKTLAKKLHPDAGGTAEEFNELTAAKDEALEELKEIG